MSQAWMILSGKGGVGKTMLTSALGMSLAKRKQDCCCVDMDMGLRNLDMLLNMQNKVVYDVLDVARKDCKIKYALIHDNLHEGLSLLPAAQLGSAEELEHATGTVVRADGILHRLVFPYGGLGQLLP